MVADTARNVALEAMTLVTVDRRPLSDCLASLVAPLDPGERARAQSLVTGALRWASRSDRLLGPHLRRRPEDRVLNAMRLALFEIFVEGTPSHAAVNGAVSMSPKRVKGLTNAVLRNVLRGEPDWGALPLPQMPKWLRKPLVAAWGKEVVTAMEAVHASDPPIDLTLKNPSESETWVERLGAERRLDGGLRLQRGGQVSALPGFDGGDWWVQDAGASVAARLLDAKPGERVLDLCAAPGGKTMQLAATGAEVTALDISRKRMKRVEENLKRTGLAAKLVTTDALDWEAEEPFDAILLDAPCSATGTLRRHPDLAYARDGSGIAELIELQAKLLDRALTWLRPGGRLVFATCSLLPDEGEVQVSEALGRHSGLRVAYPDADWIDPQWQSETGGLRLRPDHWASTGGIDGFFVAELEKAP